tara:strand:- start:2599 stop:2937 length:339 start_codon:yes stop_codon:yes gene_type:complete
VETYTKDQAITRNVEMLEEAESLTPIKCNGNVSKMNNIFEEFEKLVAITDNTPRIHLSGTTEERKAQLLEELNSKNIDYLAVLTKEKSYRMPSGLTREQRREWAKSHNQTLT